MPSVDVGPAPTLSMTNLSYVVPSLPMTTGMTAGIKILSLLAKAIKKTFSLVEGTLDLYPN